MCPSEYQHCALEPALCIINTANRHLVCAATGDDRVDIMHSLKFAARLQQVLLQSPYQRYPLLLRVRKQSGHNLSAEEKVERLNFAAEVCGAEWRL
jgi:prolyl oligopeptidase PreP (S9A serine peptidase family)